ncbi:MAG: family 10 glycosylhydrolase, partial [Bacillota bacterium]|nr:family 10 glycosylhydrolase [Bacillota bacterium]
MKFRVVLFVLFMMLQALFYPVFGQDETEERMRGIWVTTVFHLDYPSVSTTDVELLKKEAISIIENVRKSGLNTIFLQVRPSGDALYPSKYVKWSKFLTGKKGIAPSGSFDPLQFWIEEAHKRGIKLHAWMNPYRIATDMNDDVGEYPADRILKHDGRMYLNPGIPEVQKHLLQVVEEVLARYDVDGIHFDDYFYPAKDVDDQVQYEKYGAGLSIQEWRIRNVDTLIREVHDLCRKYDVRFGVSPFGIWANRNSHPLGSDTEGFESLISQYADSRKWVTNEWVDYICPQIYWHKGFRVADYEALADWWSNVVEDTDVDLYIGVASFKAMDKDTESPWYGTTELLNQLNYNTLIPNIDGEIHFRYASIFQSPVLRNAISNFYANQFEVRGYADKKLIVGRPYEDTVTYSDSFFIGGMSNPDHKLYINGELIDDRTKSGLFGRYYALSVGDNVFELVNGNERYTRVVTRKAGGGYSSKPIRHIADIFPKVWRAYRSGEEFELSCVAPAGSEVYAKLGGYVYRLEQSGDVAYGHPARYTKKVSFSPNGKARVEWLGNVVYECYQDGVLIASAAADKPIEIIMEGAPLYAEVLQDFADTYVDNSRELGAFHMIPKGTKDYVTGEDGDLYRLGSGLWVKTDAVKLVWKSLDKNRLNNMFVKSEGMTESVVFESAYTPVFYADQEEDAVAVKLHQVDFSGVNLSEVRGKLIEKAYIDNGRLMLKLKNPD